MTVRELRKLLKNFPQDLPVAYKCYSEQLLLEKKNLKVETHCLVRPDGWIQNKRPDMPSTDYLMFPGN